MSKPGYERKSKVSHGDTIYGLGMIGAWIYFIGAATGFGDGILGFLKGLVWPAFLVHAALKYLKV